MSRAIYLVLAVHAGLAGCQSPAGRPAGAVVPEQSGGGAASVLGYLNGQPIHWSDLQAPLVESGGGQVLGEIVLGRMIDQKLGERGLRVGQEMIEREKSLLASTLHDDPDQVQRLLDELRGRRGLGEHRYQQLLVRNAGLRLLVQGEVEVSEAAVAQEYELAHGPRYETRLIVVGSLPVAAGLVKRARAGESFTDLAIASSTDVSASQGGLLGAISLADPSFPEAVRQTLRAMVPGQVSDPVALDAGFAVLRLERKIDGSGVELEPVRGELSQRVRRRVERMLMQRLARAMLSESDLVVLDPLLQVSWQRQREQALQGQR